MPLFPGDGGEDELLAESASDAQQAKEAIRRGGGGLEEVELEQQPSPPSPLVRSDGSQVDIQAKPAPARAVLLALLRQEHPCGNDRVVLTRTGVRKLSMSSKASSKVEEEEEVVVGASPASATLIDRAGLISKRRAYLAFVPLQCVLCCFSEAPGASG